MRRPHTVRAAVAVVAIMTWIVAPATATTWTVAPRSSPAALALARAQAGDTVLFAAGVHTGNLRVTRRVTLHGAPGAILDGGGKGTVLTVNAPGAVVESLTIRGSGGMVLTLDAAVHVLASAGVTLRDLVVRDALYGIAVERSDSVTIERCDLEGRVTPSAVAAPAMDEAGGNGIHLWYSRNVRVARNRVARFMDGIYLSFANGTRIDGNVLPETGGTAFTRCTARRIGSPEIDSSGTSPVARSCSRTVSRSLGMTSFETADRGRTACSSAIVRTACSR